jgi:hypothetical protein
VKKPATYEVTLRRDVQQVARVRVDALSRQEAIDTAEARNADWDNVEWSVEELIGAHRPQVKLQRDTPIKGRQTGKADRRTDTDRRADKRRLGDKSSALVAARNKRKERA